MQPPPNDAKTGSWVQRAQNWLRHRNDFFCPRCGENQAGSPVYRQWRVCAKCGHHFPLDARTRIEQLADPDSFDERDKYLATHPRGLEYAERVRSAKRETRLREAAVVGSARIQDQPVMLIVLDFRFLGGTMGAAAGEKIARAFEFAASNDLPLIGVTATGGARIQEGMTALVQMAKTAAAATRLKAHGRPFITVLSNPTTGGVYASFANLADVILAEPHALIGFAGPRVVEVLTGQKLPEDSHRAEFQLEHGMIDAIVPRTELRETLALFLRNANARADAARFLAASPPLTTEPALEKPSPWESVLLARHPDRPTALDYIRRIFDDWFELHGDHLYGDDPAIVAGVARLEGQGVVVVGQERGHGDERARRRGGRAEPAGYRKAQRVMQLGSSWNLPVITFVDTPGADPGYEAEKRGVAMALADSLATMLQLRVPSVSVVIGEGGSGGALALAAADRLLMLENSVFSVISPEGASALFYGDDKHAAELADDLHLTARDLYERHIIDGIIPEPPGGAHADVQRAAELVRFELLRQIGALMELSTDNLFRARYKKYREMGLYRPESSRRLEE